MTETIPELQSEPTPPHDAVRSDIARLHGLLDGHLKRTGDKDGWDIASVIVSAITGVVLGGVGLWFTATFNDTQLANAQRQAEVDRHIKEIELVSSFVPHLEEGGRRQTAAFLAISALGNTELMVELVRLYGGEAAADALAMAGHRAETEEERATLFAAFVTLIQENRSLGEVGRNESEEREVEVTVFKVETRTRTVKVVGPVTGVEKEVEKEYVVQIPHKETKTLTVSVFVPVAIDVDSSLRQLLSDGPLPFSEVEETLSQALNVPFESLDTFRRILRWRTRTIVAGSNAGTVEYRPVPETE
jgi:hypothetical protein